VSYSRRPAVTLDPVVKRLREIGDGSPDLKEAALIYEAVLPLLRDSPLNVAPVCLTSGEARRKMGEGVPLLQGLQLELDLQGVRELMILIARALEKSVKNPYVRDIRTALEEDRLDVGMVLSETAAGQRDSIDSTAVGLGLNPDLLWTLAQFSLRPAFQAVRLQLSPMVEGVAWSKGNCYVCGSGASLAELRGNNQEKHLRCGRCGADWPAGRLHCNFCGNEDHKSLGYISAEKKEETMRVELCEKCRGYIKVIVSFSPLPPEMLSVLDLATLQLDYIARQRGYASMALRSHGPEG
jgi:FdhE protein